MSSEYLKDKKGNCSLLKIVLSFFFTTKALSNVLLIKETVSQDFRALLLMHGPRGGAKRSGGVNGQLNEHLPQLLKGVSHEN